MTVFHFDFYRLKSFDELERTGYRDCLLEESSLVFVEWPEKVMETWDDFTYMVKIEHLGSTSRNITIYRKDAKKRR
jgi:tRNA A37 threonylcarbamoyladenosine biosynthesis protein TsaE